MHKFKFPIVAGVDEFDEPALGFELTTIDMFIHDPYMDESGRSDVDPVSYYGIPQEDLDELKKIKAVVEAATFNGISQACFDVQKHLGITDGGVAGAYWTGVNEGKVRKLMFEYVELEYKTAVND